MLKLKVKNNLTKMKISVIMIYRYFDFTDISTDILTQNINDVKINEKFESIKKNSKKL